MSEPNYRPGDLVECLDDTNGAHFLVAGRRYTVQSTQRDGAGRLLVNLVGMARAWEHERFRPIPPFRVSDHLEIHP